MLQHVRITRRSLIASSIPAALFGSVLAACGGGNSSSPSSSAPSSSGSPAGGSSAGSGASSSVGGPGGATTVTVTANDFNFKFSTTTVPAGSVHFVLDNQSKTYPHQLWVYPQTQPKLQDMIAAKDASKSAGSDVKEADYLQGIAGKAEDVEPGKSASFDATLQPGTYELACFVVTSIGGKNMVHYEMGMHGLITVK